MKYILLPLSLLILFVSCSSDDSVKLSERELLDQNLQSIVESYTGEEKLVGVSISIRVNGEEYWNLSGGTSNINTPVNSDLIFGIGSATKPAVAATIMKLVDEGLLNLDDTIGDWLTIDLENVNVDVTIFNLLIHNSYFGGYMFPELWEIAENNPTQAISPTELSSWIGEPYEQPRYSNSNFLLLGMIIESVTGKTVGEVMREKFWNPLGLQNIYFPANDGLPSTNIATPWRDSDGDGVLEDITEGYDAAFHSIFYCAGGMFSTASDLSMWAFNLYGGGAISAESQSKMMTAYYDIPDETFTGYGLGTRRNVYAGKTMWGHTGGMRGYGSHMFYEPIHKLSIVLLNNQSRSENGPELRHALVEELLGEIYAYLEP